MGFNPRTHTGCDCRSAAGARGHCVSIHAPTRGATKERTHKYTVTGVSIHAPTRGATTNVLKLAYSLGSFNPRTHTGCDRSSHHNQLPSHGFNPRTHTGCDLSCLPVHEDHPSFNPRTHTGCDLDVSQLRNERNVSIHAPTRGATPFRKWLRFRYFRFNPRTHTGCDSVMLFFAPSFMVFQSTHPHGVRPFSSLRNALDMSFQSTHPHGVRLSISSTSDAMKSVSIHAPTRGATLPSCHTTL